jgi:DNA-binding MarR family transcriptional regulator
MHLKMDFGSWQALSTGYQHVTQEINDVLTRRYALPLSWFEVLAMVDRQTEPIRVSDIAELVTLSPSRVCRVLHALEDRGLITRTLSAEDARAIEITTTADGHRLAAAAEADFSSTLADAMSRHFSPGAVGALCEAGRRATAVPTTA